MEKTRTTFPIPNFLLFILLRRMQLCTNSIEILMMLFFVIAVTWLTIPACSKVNCVCEQVLMIDRCRLALLRKLLCVIEYDRTTSMCEQVLKVKKSWVCLFRGKILWREGMGGVVYGGIILQTGGWAFQKFIILLYPWLFACLIFKDSGNFPITRQTILILCSLRK